MDNWNKDTICIQGGYKPGNSEPRVLPIYQSTTYKYDSAEELAKLFDLETPGHMYTRISNPTVEYVENKIAELEGGVGAMMTSSGQAASFISVFNIASSGDNFVMMSNLYGGTTNLFLVTMKRMGIEARVATSDMSDEEFLSLFDDRTRCFFGETIANPSLEVFDFERFVPLVHSKGVPVIIDNTFATPILCNPIAFGADIVVHSTTKYMDGHAEVVGGVIVDGGTFDWTAGGKYPELTEPDESYHGVIYTKQFGNAAYITKARTQLMRDLGVTVQPLAAFLINSGLDEQVIANVIETQLLVRFGVAPTWDRCVICGRDDLPLDFSEQYGGMLCRNHWYLDERRLHLDQRTVYYLQRFSTLNLQKLNSIKINSTTKRRLQFVLDSLYDNEVGLNLKSKKFIRQMGQWEEKLKK